MMLSAYAPLFAILAVRFTAERVVWVCAGLAVAGVGALWLILHAEKGVAPATHTIARVDDHGGEATAYLASYLLPFVTISQPGWRDLVAYAMFLTVATLVHVRSSVIQINPLLFLAGYSIFRVTTAGGKDAILICRGRPTVGTRVVTSEIDHGVLLEHRAET